MGGFDPFEKVAVICKKYKLWNHVDACWGGTAFFSPKFKHLVKGAELSDSLSIDGHKGFGVPV